MTTPAILGGACAFIGDSILGPRQLVQVPGMQYLVFDYLSEMTLSSMARAKARDPAQGWANDFVDVALAEILPACAAAGIRLVANAGGLNPRACAEAIDALQRRIGTTLKVAWVEGDDCLDLVGPLRAEGVVDFYTGAPMPKDLDSANAYLGALPIARALDMGADVVITGRIVDSATTLGALIHHFGWRADEFDRLAAGSLAGHLLECGAQATGGIHTDWEDVPDWENIGYPVIAFDGDGRFSLGKPEGTGGIVRVSTVAEQVLYEVGDPANYMLPDVICDFTDVRIEQEAPDRVRVSGARGRRPSDSYKVSATYQDGFRCVAQVSVFGLDAIRKARRTGEALCNRARTLLARAGYGDFDKTAVTVIGAEDGYGPHAGGGAALREAVARVAVVHASDTALDLFARESRACGVSWAPGSTAGSALTLNGKPAVEPRYRLFTCLLAKSRLPAPSVILGGERSQVELPPGRAQPTPPPPSQAAPAPAPGPAPDDWVEVPLIRLAYARSGDKGDHSNVAIFARRPELLPYIARAIDERTLAGYLAHLVRGDVRRYHAPGLNALNFVLQHALDGGGPTSLRTDPLGKGMAQMVLGMPVRVPAAMLPAAGAP
ncbi:acyclic terpene utilization AtuA family protein [Variovorax sp. J22P271]|uniref:acyclic terpene utilization AtuA family protein n=1 Tax=Variovorax davisae TaxID=3053515 RepID=UPI00257571D7|nr:acyclic terpene utilization AtuA family protein [Variovorax sp. J22P271]MDM0034360.1 acyclic terpene utilization AtuA family protein [Variovorax sp. J22P271]